MTAFNIPSAFTVSWFMHSGLESLHNRETLGGCVTGHPGIAQTF